MTASTRRRSRWFSVGAAMLLTVLGVGPWLAGAAADASRAGCPVLPVSNSASPAASAVEAGAQVAAEPVQLPRDEAPHLESDEWWYFTGHLVGTDPAGQQRCYGFEYTTFQVLGLAPEPLYFGNVAITDLNRGTFTYGFEMDSYPVPTTPNKYSLHTGDWTMSGGSGKHALRADITGYSFDL